MHRLPILALLVGATLFAGPALSEPTVDRSANRWISDLRSDSNERVDLAIHELARMRGEAVPSLVEGLADVEIRIGCVESLARMPGDLSGPVLVDAIRAIEETDRNEVYFKAFLIGALGRLKWKPAVGFLGKLRRSYPDSRETIPMAAAWALQEITGRPHEPARDPWIRGM